VNSAAADAILFAHFAFVLFVTGGLGAIWLGALLNWAWVRNLTFRLLHLAAICYVAAEALAGVACPLTLWEDALRGRESDVGFIARWVRRLLYYELPDWVFGALYVGFAALVLLTFRLVPPKRQGRSGNRAA
jgi:hypothetical protein